MVIPAVSNSSERIKSRNGFIIFLFIAVFLSYSILLSYLFSQNKKSTHTRATEPEPPGLSNSIAGVIKILDLELLPEGIRNEIRIVPYIEVYKNITPEEINNWKRPELVGIYETQELTDQKGYFLYEIAGLANDQYLLSGRAKVYFGQNQKELFTLYLSALDCPSNPLKDAVWSDLCLVHSGNTLFFMSTQLKARMDNLKPYLISGEIISNLPDIPELKEYYFSLEICSEDTSYFVSHLVNCENIFEPYRVIASSPFKRIFKILHPNMKVYGTDPRYQYFLSGDFYNKNSMKLGSIEGVLGEKIIINQKCYLGSKNTGKPIEDCLIFSNLSNSPIWSNYFIEFSLNLENPLKQDNIKKTIPVSGKIKMQTDKNIALNTNLEKNDHLKLMACNILQGKINCLRRIDLFIPYGSLINDELPFNFRIIPEGEIFLWLDTVIYDKEQRGTGLHRDYDLIWTEAINCNAVGGADTFHPDPEKIGMAKNIRGCVVDITKNDSLELNFKYAK